jgi:uncharacterized protein (TIGR03067 family)
MGEEFWQTNVWFTGNAIMRLTIGLILTAGLLVAADKPQEAAVKKELEMLQGSWTITSAEKDGKPDDGLKNGKLVFTGDKFIRTAGGTTMQGTIKVNPAAKPKTLDGTFTSGDKKGKSQLAIYSLEGATLKICSSLSGKERPKEFTGKAGSGNLLIVLKRDAAPAKAPAAAKTDAAPAKPAPAVPVKIPDKNLEAAIRAALHEPTAPLTEEKLHNVFILEAPGKGISNLAGLEKCRNLALLKLTKNQVSDLQALKELTNLQSLDLAENKITDISPLAGLTKLQYLELSKNGISKLGPLGGLTSLQALYLSGNKISDVTPLAGMVKLSSLALGQNQIKDIHLLDKVNKLMVLDLNDNQLESLAPVTKQTELSMLLVERNKITDLAPLIPWAKADADGAKRFAPYLKIYLKGNPLSDAAKTTQMATLKGFGVRFE